MAVIMEFIVVAIYIGFGITLPISKDDDQYKATHMNADYENAGYAPGGRMQGGYGQGGNAYPMGRR